MDQDARIRQVLQKKYGLRVGPEMSRYVLSRLEDSDGEPVPIRAGDARTGVAVRRLLPAAELQSAMQVLSQLV